MSTEISGAVPIRIAAREGPASRTARMKRIWETPGTIAPTTKKGQRSEGSIPLASSESASAAPVRKPSPVMTSAPASGSAPRVRPARTARVKTPKRAPASTPKTTASTVLGSRRGSVGGAHRADPRRDARREGVDPEPVREPVQRAVVGGCALGLATGWNIANTGSVASQLPRHTASGSRRSGSSRRRSSSPMPPCRSRREGRPTASARAGPASSP